MAAANVQDDRVNTKIYVPNDGQEFWRQNAMKRTTEHSLFTE